MTLTNSNRIYLPAIALTVLVFVAGCTANRTTPSAQANPQPAQYNQTPPTTRMQPAPQEQPRIQQQPVAPPDNRFVEVEQVQKYLGNLRQIETDKQLLVNRVLAVDQAQQANRDDNRTAQERIEDAQNSSQSLAAEFNRLRTTTTNLYTPAACTDLAQKYIRHLANAEMNFRQMMDALTISHTNPNRALAIIKELREGQTHIQRQNDDAAAEQALSALCERYHIAKDFKVMH